MGAGEALNAPYEAPAQSRNACAMAISMVSVSPRVSDALTVEDCDQAPPTLIDPVGAEVSRLMVAETLLVTRPALSRASSHTVFTPSLPGAATVQVLVALKLSQATPVMSCVLD